MGGGDREGGWKKSAISIYMYNIVVLQACYFIVLMLQKGRKDGFSLAC